MAATASARGIEDSLIKTMGRWESVAYIQYVCILWEQLSGVACQNDLVVLYSGSQCN